jgi:hypothetical protein
MPCWGRRHDDWNSLVRALSCNAPHTRLLGTIEELGAQSVIVRLKAELRATSDRRQTVQALLLQVQRLQALAPRLVARAALPPLAKKVCETQDEELVPLPSSTPTTQRRRPEIATFSTHRGQPGRQDPARRASEGRAKTCTPTQSCFVAFVAGVASYGAGW